MKPVKDLTKTIDSLTEAQWKNLYLAHARGERSDIIPFPSEEIQVITNGQKSERTARGAISILDSIMSCVTDQMTLTKETRVLDYGCGWGRMTRLMSYYFNINSIAGVDVDKSLINSANELLPHMNHIVINSMEKLPFEDASFDLIFANSVFSHLSEKSCLFALTELSRILSKKGILVISVLEEHEMIKFYSNANKKDWITKILGEQNKAISKLKTDGFIWGDTRRWHEYGIAIMNDDWIAKHFKSVGIEYLSTKRGSHQGTHNYKSGIKI